MYVPRSVPSLTGCSYTELRSGMYAALADEWGRTAILLAYIAEFDYEQYYVAEGYSSMFAYCVDAMEMSDDVAYRRLHAARAARLYPEIFDMVADGRLHLSGISLVAPLLEKLTVEDAEALLAAIAHQTKRSIEQLIAVRFPRPDVRTTIRPVKAAAVVFPASPAAAPLPLAAAGPSPELGPGQVVFSPRQGLEREAPPALVTAQPAPTRYPRVKPLSPESYDIRMTLSREAHDHMRRIQELLSHGGRHDARHAVEQALAHYCAHLDKQKFATTSKPRKQAPTRKSSTNSRYIPARVRRAVRKRDQGRCTFESDTGHRCGARALLEFDHIIPIARGGESTLENIRLRCRTHNQYEAERLFGERFMDAKRKRPRDESQGDGYSRAMVASSGLPS